jgi:hypothetical protein
MSASIWASTSSSSTTRMRALGISTGTGSGARMAGCPRKTGKCTVTVVPTFSWLSMRTRPPCRDTMPYTTDSPSPVPRAPLVVKKGSKARRRTAGPGVAEGHWIGEASRLGVAPTVAALLGLTLPAAERPPMWSS